MTRAGSLAELRRLAEVSDRVLFVPKGPTGKLPDGGVPFVLPATILALLDAPAAIERMLDHWGDSRPEGWEPEQSDGCWPYGCDCGFVEAIHDLRLAVGRPCCGEPIHPIKARQLQALAASPNPDRATPSEQGPDDGS